MNNPTIETDIAEILKDLQKGQHDILKEISDLRVNLEGVKGDIKAVKGDIKALDAKVEQLDKRVANQEFLNRGVFEEVSRAISGNSSDEGFCPPVLTRIQSFEGLGQIIGH